MVIVPDQNDLGIYPELLQMEQTTMSSNDGQLDRGVLYIATGNKYVNEVFSSAQSLKNTNPNLHCTLITDKPVESGQIDKIILKNNPVDMTPKSFKLTNMSHSPYSKTIFLDSDTHITNNIEEMYQILNHFDIAAAHAPARNTNRLPELPAWFPEYNTGVLAYSTRVMKKFSNQWWENYKKLDYNKDQPSFRKTLFNNDNVAFFTLTPEYNKRTNFPGYLDKNPKILHERGTDFENITKAIERTSGPRVHYRKNGHIKCKSNYQTLYNRIISSVIQDGFFMSFKKGVEMFIENLNKN